MATCEQEVVDLQFDDQGVETDTSEEQIYCERTCWPLLTQIDTAIRNESLRPLIDRGISNDAGRVLLRRGEHLTYLKRGLNKLSAGHVCLDASRPWLIYWMCHSVSLLGVDFFGNKHAETTTARIVDTLRRCRSPSGGFGGGPQQLAHLAPTYAAVLALCTISTDAALRIPRRASIYRWFLSLKRPDGSFRVHDDGESDIRGSYLCLAVAKILNILTPELCRGAASFVASCCSSMGGFGGEPGNEGHGGYAFNAVASLAILDRLDVLDSKRFLRWLCGSQMRLAGGFQGRINKLVDGCYSFWQGAVPAILSAYGPKDGSGDAYALPNYDALQRYILLCCQQQNGGLRDKPSKPRDHYHTCYCLSGLSVAQHAPGATLVGDEGNRLGRTDPVMNVRSDLLARAMAYYETLPSRHEELLSASSE